MIRYMRTFMLMMPSRGTRDASEVGEGLYTIHYCEGESLPRIRQSLTKRPRPLYLHVTIDNDQVHRRSLNGSDVTPITIYAHAQSVIRLRLFAKRLIKEDICVATSGDMELHTLKTEWPFTLLLESCHHEANIDDLYMSIHVVAQKLEDIDMDNSVVLSSATQKWQEMNECVKQLIEIGGIVAEVNPVAQAIMSLLEAGVDHLEVRMQRDKAIQSLFNEIARASKRLLDFCDPRYESRRQRQNKTRKVLLREIYKALAFIRSLSTTSFIRRSTSETSAQIESSREKIRTLMREFESNGHVDAQDAVFRILGEVEKMCLERLPYAKDVQAGSSRGCLPGTRTTLLRDIEQWALDPTASRAYILYGAAGTGKSAVAHAVSVRLDDTGVVTPFFAFDRTDRNRSAHQLFPSLARSLAERDESYCSHLCGLSMFALCTHDIADQCKHLILEALTDCTFGMPVVFVIDALDECADAGTASAIERRNILQNLQKRIADPNLPWNVRFLITCRPDKDIRAHLIDRLGASATCKTIDSAGGTEDDIRKFVESELAHTDVHDLVDDVTRAAQTLFECAAVLCRELCRVDRPKSVTTSTRRQLVQRVLDHPGRALYESYGAILENHFNVHDDKDIAMLRLVLAWVFAVESPQSRCVFTDLASVMTPLPLRQEIDTVFTGLGSLLTGTVTGDNAPVRPLHTSFRDFVLDSKESGSFAIDSEFSVVDGQLAYVCLRVMNNQYIGLRFNICCLCTSFAFRDDIPGLDDSISEHTTPGLRYACHATAGHLLRSGGNGSNYNVRDEVDFFLERQFLFWLEACSCLGLHDTGVFLKDFLRWAEMLEDRAREALLTDFIKFETRFCEGVKASPPQVYLSGLVLSPRCSAVYQLYSQRFDRLAQAPMYIREESWPADEATVMHAHSAVLSVACSPDGAHIASGSRDSMVRIWDVAKRQPQYGLAGHKGIVRSVAFSRDGKLVASSSDDWTVRVWDASTGDQLLGPFRGHRGSVETVAFSPDGKIIASGSDDKTIRLWGVAEGQQLGQTMRGHEDWVHSLVFSAYGRTIASSSADCTIRIWDVATQSQSREPLTGHTDRALSLAISRDGRQVASGSADNTIRLWDTRDWEQPSTALNGHSDRVLSVAFSFTGGYIASGSDDRTVRLWSTKSGQALRVILVGHELPITSVAFSSDDHLVSASVDRTIRVWGTPQQLQESSAGAQEPYWPSILSDHDQADEYEDWLVDSRNNAARKPLIWIPHHLRRHSHLSTTDNYRSLNIDISDAAFGLEWASIYKHES